MCVSKKQQAPTTPAPAPAPPIAPAEVPEVGEARRAQSKELYGEEVPNYRVKRTAGGSMTPNSQITM